MKGLIQNLRKRDCLPPHIWPTDGPPYLLQKSTTARLYNPLANPDLFWEFLNLPLTQDDILEFANTYGFLSQGRNCFDERDKPVLGESLYFWLYAKAEMNMLFNIDQWIQHGDGNRLKEVIGWSKNGTCVTFHYSFPKNWAINNCYPPQVCQTLGQKNSREPESSKRWDRWERDDLIAPAKALLISRVNQCLKGTSHQLLIDNNEKIRPYIHPMILLDALWLQFAQHIAEERRLRPCKFCNKLMDVTNYRRDKSVHPKCSKRERQRKWRANINNIEAKAVKSPKQATSKKGKGGE